MVWACAGFVVLFGLQQSRQRLLVAPDRMLTCTTHPAALHVAPFWWSELPDMKQVVQGVCFRLGMPEVQPL